MSVFGICILGVAGAVLSIYLKQTKPEFALVLSLAVCTVIILYVTGKLTQIAEAIEKINSYINIDTLYFGILLKMIGITYISEFAADICKDSGHHAVANQIQIFGKLTIMAVSMPVFLNLLDTIAELL